MTAGTVPRNHCGVKRTALFVHFFSCRQRVRMLQQARRRHQEGKQARRGRKGAQGGGRRGGGGGRGISAARRGRRGADERIAQRAFRDRELFGHPLEIMIPLNGIGEARQGGQQRFGHCFLVLNPLPGMRAPRAGK